MTTRFSTPGCFVVFHCGDPMAMLFPAPERWLVNNSRAFRRVARVCAPLAQVFRLTNHIDHDWTTNPEVVWADTSRPLRSTSVGDVILGGRQAWLVTGSDLREITYPSTPPLASFAAPDGISCLAFSGDGQRLAVGEGRGDVALHAGGAGGDVALQERYRRGGRPATKLAWSHDGRFLAMVGDAGIPEVWDIPAGEHLVHYPAVPPVLDLCWHGGHLLFVRRVAEESAGDSASIQVWDAHAGEERFACPASATTGVEASLSPQGSFLALAQRDGVIEVWNPASGARRMLAPGGLAGGNSPLAWSPGGEWLAAGACSATAEAEEATVDLWAVASPGKRRRLKLSTYSAEGARTLALAFSPDGAFLAAATSDGCVQLWRTRGGRQCFTYHGNTSPLRAVAWSPDGSRLASGGADNNVQIWATARD